MHTHMHTQSMLKLKGTHTRYNHQCHSLADGTNWTKLAKYCKGRDNTVRVHSLLFTNVEKQTINITKRNVTKIQTCSEQVGVQKTNPIHTQMSC